MKILKITIATIVCLLSVVFVLSPTITLNQYKNLVKKITADNQSIEIKTLGDITLHIMPPKLIFHNVMLNYKKKNLMTAETMEIPIMLHQVLYDSIDEVTEITFSNGIFSVLTLQKFFNESKTNIQEILGLKKLYLRNFTYSTKSYLMFNKSKNSLIKTAIITNEGPIYRYRGEFFLNDNIIKGDGTIDKTNPDEIMFTMDITSKHYNISLYPTKKYKGNHLNHKLNIVVNDLNSLLNNTSTKEIQDNKQSIGEGEKLEEKQPIAFKYQSDFFIASDFISVDNIIINSPIVENFNGDLALKIYKDYIEYYLNLSADKIDLSEFAFFYSNESKIERIKKFAHRIVTTNFNLFNLMRTNGIAKINVRKLKTIDSNIELLKVEAIDLPSITYFTNIEAILPGKTYIDCNASLLNAEIRPELNATIRINTKDINLFSSWLGFRGVNKAFADKYLKDMSLDSKLYVIPFSMSLEKINIKSHDSNLSGRLSLAKGTKQNTNLYLFLNGDKINLDDLSINQYYDYYLKILHSSDYDPTGQAFYSQTGNHNWLRKINDRTCVNLNFKQASFKNIELRDFYTDIILESGNFSINALKFNSDALSTNLTFKFSLPLFRPYINAEVFVKNMNCQKVPGFLPKFEIKNNNLNFFSASQYDGQLNLNADHMLLNNKTVLENLKLRMALLEGELDIKNLEYDVFDGKAKIQANVYLNGGIPQITTAFSATNIDPQKLLDSIWNIKKISGYASFVGLFNTMGATYQNLIHNTNGQINFSCKDIKWSGIGIDEIIKTTDDPTKGTIENKVAVLDYSSKYGETYFDSIRGVINVNGGLAKINKTLCASSRLSGSYTANIDIGEKQIKSLMQISFIPMGQYRPLNISITNNGPLSQQKRVINLKEIFTFLNYDPEARRMEEEKTKQSKTPIRAQVIYIIQEARKNQTPATQPIIEKITKS